MNRAQMLYATDSIIELAKSTEEGQEPLVFIPIKTDLTDEEKIEDEYEALGFFVTKNPLDDHSVRLDQLDTTEDMTPQLEREAVHMGGLMTDLKSITTKKGKEMAFFTLEDLKGRVEVVVFPSIYQRNKHLFKKNSIIELFGVLEIQTREINGEEITILKIKVTKIKPIKAGRITKKVMLYPAEKDDFERICDIIKSNPGEVGVEVLYHNVILRSQYKVSYDSKVLEQLERDCHLEKIYQE